MVVDSLCLLKDVTFDLFFAVPGEQEVLNPRAKMTFEDGHILLQPSWGKTWTMHEVRHCLEFPIVNMGYIWIRSCQFTRGYSLIVHHPVTLKRSQQLQLTFANETKTQELHSNKNDCRAARALWLFGWFSHPRAKGIWFWPSKNQLSESSLWHGGRKKSKKHTEDLVQQDPEVLSEPESQESVAFRRKAGGPELHRVGGQKTTYIIVDCI